MIPVTIVTGFLGSGKTTLIRKALHDPAFSNTAVIVNEFGEVGLDHDLLVQGDESVIMLDSGCLCCVVQSNLAMTLMDLWDRRARGSVAYERVLVETSGLSDPGPLLQSVMADPILLGLYDVPYVVTLVDAQHGEVTLADHREARNQVILADRIVFTKLDIQPCPARLMTTVARLNEAFGRLGPIARAELNLFTLAALEPRLDKVERLGERKPHDGITSFTLIRERAIPAIALTLLLQAVAEHVGAKLLRLKGLVAIEEMPGRPAVVHGVRHIIAAPEFLPCWPSADERTRLVFITTSTPRYFVERLLDAIEDEVHETLRY